MRRDDVIEALLSEIRSAKKAAEPLCVGIDGVDAAGKTVLADELGEAGRKSGLIVLRASIDGFHNPRERRYRRGANSPEGYYRDSFDYGALRASLLDPLKSGGAGRVVARAYDFRAESPVEPLPSDFDERTILIFEGVFLQCAELDPYWDLRIYVHAGFETTLGRAIGRDGALLGGEDEVRRKYLARYIPGQQLYIKEREPIARAWAVVVNDFPGDPELVADSRRRAELTRATLNFDAREGDGRY
jgi:uridine kinase